MTMAKKIFAGRHQETVRRWNIMFQQGGQVCLSQAVSLGPLDLDELRKQLNLHSTATVLAELAS